MDGQYPYLMNYETAVEPVEIEGTYNVEKQIWVTDDSLPYVGLPLSADTKRTVRHSTQSPTQKSTKFVGGSERTDTDHDPDTEVRTETD